MVCKIKGCPRRHADGMVIEEALIHPPHREIDPRCFYEVLLKQGTEMVKIGSAVATAYGFSSVRHVIYDASGEPRAPLEEFALRAHDGSISQLEPRSVVCPRAEQLAQGQENDFCKFRTVSADFNKAAHQHRVYMKKLDSGNTEVRMLRSPRDNLVGDGRAVVEFGLVKEVKREIGVAYSTLNTVRSDSGAPIFDVTGHLVGLHQGHVQGRSVNAFVLFYPITANPWFVQAEPKN